MKIGITVQLILLLSLCILDVYAGKSTAHCYQCTATWEDKRCVTDLDSVEDSTVSCKMGDSCFCYTQYIIGMRNEVTSMTRGIKTYSEDTQKPGCSEYGKNEKSCFDVCYTSYCNNKDPAHPDNGDDDNENPMAGHKVILHDLPEWRSDWNYDSRGIKCKRTMCSGSSEIVFTLSCIIFALLAATANIM